MVTQSPVRFPDSLQESFSLTIFMYSVNSKSFYMQKKIIQKNQSDLQRKKTATKSIIFRYFCYLYKIHHMYTKTISFYYYHLSKHIRFIL